MDNIGIRWRLTLAYGVILTAVLAGLALFLYRQQESFLIDNSASRVRSQASVAIASLPASDPLGDLDEAATSIELALAGPDSAATLLALNGEPLTNSATAETVALPDDDYARVRSGERTQRVVDVDGGRVVSVLVPVRDSRGDVAALLQIDTSLVSVDASLGRLQLLLTIGVVIAHVFGLTLIFGFTSWSLRPLTRIADACRAIASGDLADRSRLPKGPDELGELGRAFDAMIEEVQSTAGERERSEQLARQFAADASHELKSPLTVISGYLDVLLRGGSEDRAQLQRALAGMQRETERMSRLVTDLLELAQLEAGSRVMQRKTLSLADLLAQERDDAELRSTDHELVLEIEHDATVLADPEALRQALRNLIDNAVRHSDAGARITLTLATDGGAAIVRVSDTGCGIAPEHLPRIFDRFYRADEARSRGVGKAGLGLAITRSLIERNDGVIGVESEPGRGTTFTIRLPIAERVPVSRGLLPSSLASV
jgi:two-component system, OmpR family, sensor kinase